MKAPTQLLPTARGRRSRRGSVLLPVVAAMLVLLVTGVTLAETHGAQRMRAVLAVQAAQAHWVAEAGAWAAASEESEVSGAVSFGAGSYTVTKVDSLYTATAACGEAQRTFALTANVSTGSGLPTPIALWLFDETSGTTVADSIGSNDGTLNGGVTLGVTGPSGGGTAVSFDGSNDYIEVPHSSDFLLDDGSVSFWFRMDSTSWPGLVTKDSAYYDTGGHLEIYLSSTSVIVRFQSTSASYYVIASSVASLSTWHHVVFTFGSGGMELYFDGALRDVDAYTGGMATTSGGTGNAEPMVFGADTYTSGDGVVTPLTDYFDGSLDSIAFYDTVLTAAQVLELYTAAGSMD